MGLQLLKRNLKLIQKKNKTKNNDVSLFNRAHRKSELFRTLSFPQVSGLAFWCFGKILVNLVVLVARIQPFLTVIIKVVSSAEVFIFIDFVTVLVIDLP